MKGGLTLTVILIWANQVYAILGETEQQIEKRYGRAVQTELPDVDSLTAKKYSKNGLDIIVNYLHGNSCCELFFHSSLIQFSEQEIMTLLDISTFGSKWVAKEDGDDTHSLWLLENGEAKAVNTDGIFFEMFTKGYDILYAAKLAKEAELKENAVKGHFILRNYIPAD